jgi:transcriptional regulator with AAA-type ATPase domain
MPRMDGEVRSALAAVAALTDCNPFLPERIALEQRILGPAFLPVGTVWRAEGDADLFDPNLPRLRERVTEVVGTAHAHLAAHPVAAAADLADDYRNAVLYLLWLRYEDPWYALIDPAGSRGALRTVSWYPRFARDAGELLAPLREAPVDPAHLFALGFQARRAFHHVFRQIFGATLPAARLRANVWRSIFTRDLARYRRAFYQRMADIPTLITGESGTGKELVARAIALSQYIPFDGAAQTFAADPDGGCAAVNLAALSPTLIESEMFGHHRGAFTGAVEDRAGWFERCGPHGAVFLDEIGELDAAIQVKLLRVLQSREFHRIGETDARRFAGKVIAATHRDLPAAIAAGRFREDLYYRLCADVIEMPTLREQVAANPDDLRTLILIVARRIAGADEAEWLADEVHRWVLAELGLAYPWPGNIRELEQCVRNVLVRGEYRPRDGHAQPATPDAADALAAAFRRGAFSADQLVQRYVEVVYAETGSMQETARLLGIDWRTVRARLHSHAASTASTAKQGG